MPKPTVLFYAPQPAPWSPKLPQLCAIQGLKFQALSDADLGRTVGALAQGLPAGEAVSPLAPLPESLLLFCFLTDRQLDRLLSALRKAGVPHSCLKAVLTPDNAGWTLRALYDELTRERQQLN